MKNRVYIQRLTGIVCLLTACMALTQNLSAQESKHAFRFSFGGAYTPMNGIRQIGRDAAAERFYSDQEKDTANLYFAFSYVKHRNDSFRWIFSIEHFRAAVKANGYNSHRTVATFPPTFQPFSFKDHYYFYVIPLTFGFEYSPFERWLKITPHIGLNVTVFYGKLFYEDKQFESETVDKFVSPDFCSIINVNKGAVAAGATIGIDVQVNSITSYYIQTLFRAASPLDYDIRHIDTDIYLSGIFITTGLQFNLN